jgi:hypothetical protein
MNPARFSCVCAIIGLSLWLVSYSWIPLSIIPSLQGRDLGFLAPVFPLSEGGAILVALVGISSGIAARQSSRPGRFEHRRATRYLMFNIFVPFLVVVPNIVFPLLGG